jgi:chromosome segregation ATPase
MEIMKIKLSERTAVREREICEERLKSLVKAGEGDRKKFMDALEKSSKCTSHEERLRQLESKNIELETQITKVTIEKQEAQATSEKLKAKMEEKEKEVMEAKALQSQRNYYKSECEKLEKAYLNIERQFEEVKQHSKSL